MVAATTAGPRRGWTLALASVGTFMSALDVVVVSTALPTLAEAVLVDGSEDPELLDRRLGLAESDDGDMPWTRAIPSSTARLG